MKNQIVIHFFAKSVLLKTVLKKHTKISEAYSMRYLRPLNIVQEYFYK